MFFLIFAIIVVFTSGVSSAEFRYCNANNSYIPLPNQAELLLVNLFTRHGERTPTQPLPIENGAKWNCDPESVNFNHQRYSKKFVNPTMNNNRKKKFNFQQNPFSKLIWEGSCVDGQLTPKGSKQLYDLGERLSLYYQGFITDPKKIYARSTNVFRTQQSAIALLNGLFHTKNVKKFPIFTYPSEIETLVPPKNCPALRRLEMAYRKSPTYLDSWKKTRPLLEKFDFLSGMETANVVDGASIAWDQVISRRCDNQPEICLPNKKECLDEKFTKKLEKSVDVIYADFFKSSGVLLNKFRTGSIFKEVLENLQRKLKGESKFDMFYYSGHDVTILPLLGALLSKDMRWPPYASSLIIELYRLWGVEYVRILYNGQILESEICDFRSGCKLDTFVGYLNSHIVVGDELFDLCEIKQEI